MIIVPKSNYNKIMKCTHFCNFYKCCLFIYKLLISEFYYINHFQLFKIKRFCNVYFKLVMQKEFQISVHNCLAA